MGNDKRIEKDEAIMKGTDVVVKRLLFDDNIKETET